VITLVFFCASISTRLKWHRQCFCGCAENLGFKWYRGYSLDMQVIKTLSGTKGISLSTQVIKASSDT
jgi:hypothetical protein